MMAVDSLHAAVPLVVPSGVSACCSSACRRACSARAFAPPSAQPSDVQASCLERARPAAQACPSARSPVGWLRVQQSHRAADARSGSEGKGGRQDKGRGTGPHRKPVCTWGSAARSGFAAVPLGAQARANAGMSRASHDRTRQSLQERSHDRPPRRRFPHPPQRPEEPGPELRFQGAQTGRQGQQRQVLGAPSRRCQRLWEGQRAAAGSRLGRGHTAARFAGAKLTPMSRRVTIKTLLVNQRKASPQSLAKHLRYIERDGVGRDGEPGQPTGRRPMPPTSTPSRNAAPTTGTISASSSRPRMARNSNLRTYTRHLMGRMEASRRHGP